MSDKTMNLDDLIKWIEEMRNEASATYVKYKQPGDFLPGKIGAGHEIIKHIKANRAALEAGMRGVLRFKLFHHKAAKGWRGRLLDKDGEDNIKVQAYAMFPAGLCDHKQTAIGICRRFAASLGLTAEFKEEPTDDNS